MPFSTGRNKKFTTCPYCQLTGIAYGWENVSFIQEQLMQAIHILGLLVEYSPNKKITIAEHIFNTEEVALMTVNLMSLEHKLNTIQDSIKKNGIDLND